MADHDGSRLNLASQLAQAAADLQKVVSNRSGRGSDPVLLAALDDVKSATRSLATAVQRLAGEVAEEPEDDGGG